MPAKDGKRLIMSLTVISVVLGFMLAVQYKNTQLTNEQIYGPKTGNSDLRQAREALTQVKDTNKDLDNQINNLKKELLTMEQKHTSALTDEIQKQLSNTRILAGTTPVKGTGIVLVIDDSRKGTQQVSNITHDTDIKQVVNELFLAGAEAVAVNGQRIATTSSVFCIGPTVKVNDRYMAAPYKIEAIGDPATLIKALTWEGGVLDYLRSNNRNLTVQLPKSVPVLHLPAYSGDFNKLTVQSSH